MQPVFHVSDRAREIVDSLKEVLECTVLLYDAQEGRMHLYRVDGDWMSFKSAGISEDQAPGGCRIDQPINQRWWLHLARKSAMHPDVRRLAPWAAAALAQELPAANEAKPSFPPAGGGPGGGPAQLGIPVAWTRKTKR
jgi:hypothetical protein